MKSVQVVSTNEMAEPHRPESIFFPDRDRFGSYDSTGRVPEKWQNRTRYFPRTGKTGKNNQKTGKNQVHPTILSTKFTKTS
jgi:hypothetical protein